MSDSEIKELRHAWANILSKFRIFAIDYDEWEKCTVFSGKQAVDVIHKLSKMDKNQVRLTFGLEPREEPKFVGKDIKINFDVDLSYLKPIEEIRNFYLNDAVDSFGYTINWDRWNNMNPAVPINEDPVNRTPYVNTRQEEIAEIDDRVTALTQETARLMNEAMERMIYDNLVDAQPLNVRGLSEIVHDEGEEPDSGEQWEEYSEDGERLVSHEELEDGRYVASDDEDYDDGDEGYF